MSFDIVSAAQAVIPTGDPGHQFIVDFLNQRFTDLYWWFGVIIALLFGSYAFTGGAYIYTYMISSRLFSAAEKIKEIEENHLRHIEERLSKLEHH